MKLIIATLAITLALIVGLCFVPVTETEVQETTVGYTLNNQPGMKMDNINCLNMVTGKIEICVR